MPSGAAARQWCCDGDPVAAYGSPWPAGDCGGRGNCRGGIRATELARSGCRVILLERTSHPSHKVCGEFLSQDAQAALAALGIDARALGATGVDRFRLVKRERYAEAPLPFAAAGLSAVPRRGVARRGGAGGSDRRARCGCDGHRGDRRRSRREHGAARVAGRGRRTRHRQACDARAATGAGRDGRLQAAPGGEPGGGPRPSRRGATRLLQRRVRWRLPRRGRRPEHCLGDARVARAGRGAEVVCSRGAPRPAVGPDR